MEADRKSKVRCEAVAEIASPLAPSTPRASRPLGAPSHRAGTEATPSPCMQLNPILAVTSHLLGIAAHNYERSEL